MRKLLLSLSVVQIDQFFQLLSAETVVAPIGLCILVYELRLILHEAEVVRAICKITLAVFARLDIH